MPDTTLKSPLLLLAGALGFSTTGFAQALAPDGATPYVIGAVRMLGGGLALLLWCAWRGRLPGRRGWPPGRVLPAALALVGFQICFFRGVLDAGVAVGTVASIGFAPVAAAVLGRVVLRERPSRAWYPSTALALLGLALLHLHAAGDAGGGSLPLPLAAGACYACYYVFSKPLGQAHPPETVMAVLCTLSGVLLAPLLLFQPVAWLATGPGLLTALHLTLVTTAAAFSLTLAGLRTTPTATAATLGLAEPLGAACLGILCLHEYPGPAGYAGMGLILASVLLLVLAPARR